MGEHVLSKQLARCDRLRNYGVRSHDGDGSVPGHECAEAVLIGPGRLPSELIRVLDVLEWHAREKRSQHLDEPLWWDLHLARHQTVRHRDR